VPDAIVTVVGRSHARVATDADGGFTTLNLPLGPVELEVGAPNFEPLKVVTTVVAGRPEHVVVTMRPRVPVATVHGRVSSREGQGLDATLKFTGKGGNDGNFETRTDATGGYSLTLPAGTYRVRSEARALPAREAELQVAAGDDRALDFMLRPAPSSPNVYLAGESIRTKQAIRFAGATATLLPGSAKILDGVAELLEVHVEIKRVQIVAHWDDAPLQSGGADALTLAQAEAVKGYLVGRGISGDRLATSGAGASRPVVPNLNPANRARNRRIEFHLE
jgi:outer membrane protein OmpA-like peptidoglycan-associated protein